VGPGSRSVGLEARVQGPGLGLGLGSRSVACLWPRVWRSGGLRSVGSGSRSRSRV
jgi:hypothetical protein